jgi:NADPH:quinone reductase-like Zn-dependent oxidoreductase
MKAVFIRSPGGLTVGALDDPGDPGAGEIRVRVHGSSLNYHDYIVASSAIPRRDGLVPMSDGAGVVEAVGAGVTEFAPGDHVVSVFFPQWQTGPANVSDFTGTPGDGVDGYARQFVVRPATWFTRAPQHYSHTEAATLTTAGLTAWRALVVDGGLKAGDTVLALGTGGVSIFALQIARMMGATVILTSSSDQKLERARRLGATHTINYKSTPEWGKRVLELTGGRGVDHIIEVGGPGTLPQSLTCVARGGHIALIGVLTGHAGHIPTVLLMSKHARIQGLIVGSRSQQQDFVRAIDVTGLKPIIDRTFPLESISDAFKLEASGGHFGKICLEF